MIDKPVIPQVYKAIVAVMHDIGETGIAKGRRNEQQGYKFRGIDDVYNELNSLLSKHSLILLPTVISREQVERVTAKGSPIFFTNVIVQFEVVCALDGSIATIRTVGEAMDSGDKSSNKALSAAYKYAAMMMFCIPTEGDNDADHTTHEVAPKPMSKATANPEYKRLSEGIREIARVGNAEDLFAYWTKNQPTIAALPPDWLQHLTNEKNEAKVAIAARPLGAG